MDKLVEMDRFDILVTMRMFNSEKIAAKKYKDYIEGQIPFEIFWAEYINSSSLQRHLSKVAKRSKHNICCINKRFFAINPSKREQPDFRTKSLLQESIIAYLTKKQIDFKPFVVEYFLYKKWNDFIPSFVPSNESTYYMLEKFSGGKKLSKKQCRDYFTEIYHYEKYPPRWLHMPEWPSDIDGMPATFLYQTGYPNTNDYIEYWFQKKDGTKVKVEQYD